MIIENGSDSFLRSSKYGELMGKESVCARFKLRPEAVEMLSILAARTGIEQKSLFDGLIDDEDALCATAESFPSVLRANPVREKQMAASRSSKLASRRRLADTQKPKSMAIAGTGRKLASQRKSRI